MLMCSLFVCFVSALLYCLLFFNLTPGTEKTTTTLHRCLAALKSNQINAHIGKFNKSIITQRSLSPFSARQLLPSHEQININIARRFGTDLRPRDTEGSKGATPSITGFGGLKTPRVEFQLAESIQEKDTMNNIESHKSENMQKKDETNITRYLLTPLRFLWRALWVLLALFVLVFTYSFVRVDTCPFTNRKRFIFVSLNPSAVGAEFFEKIITDGQMIPSTNHDTHKVRLILERIQSSMDRVIKRRPQHLEGIEWQIHVVTKPGENGRCFPSGKIIINQDYLHYFLQTDGKIAFAIAHEVGHVLAEHGFEMVGNALLAGGGIVFMITFYIFISPPPLMFFGVLSSIIFGWFIRLWHLCQRQEFEADHIGILLSASAGYDPQEGPKYFMDMAPIHDVLLNPYVPRLHPHARKRAKALLQSEAMDKALAIYNREKQF